MTGRRIQSIDVWKGITILSVLNLHTVFWSGSIYLPNWFAWLSLLLDVPVFFFISGFLFGGQEAHTAVQRGGRQIVRLLGDYAVVAAVAWLSGLVIIACTGGVPVSRLWTSIVSGLLLEPHGVCWDSWNVFGGSMWFLRTYLAVIPIGLCLLSVTPKRAAFIPCLSALLLFAAMRQPLSPQPLFLSLSLVFHFGVFMAGAAFRTVRRRFSAKKLCMALAGLVLLSVLIILVYPERHNLQAEKFPPTLIHLLVSSYSILAFCILLEIEDERGVIPLPERIRSALCWCGQNSYRIYLWQGLITSVPFLFIPVLIQSGIPSVAIYIICLTWNVAATLSLVVLHQRVEETLIAWGRQRSWRSRDLSHHGTAATNQLP